MSLDNADNLEIDGLINNESTDLDDQIDNDNQDNEDDNEDELEISIDDEDSQTSEDNSNESSTINKLRKELRQARQQLSTTSTVTKQTEPEIELGEKPTLESLEYDTDKYEAELAAYYDRQQKIKDQQSSKEKEQQKLKDEQTKQVTAYNEQAKALKAKNFKDMEQEFVSNVSKEQGSAILRAADNKALVVYALGSNPHTLDKLLTITDPFKLAAEIGKFESKIKMNRKGVAPKPEQGVKGKVASVASASNDKQLERLEAQAAKTGDRSAIIAYKKQLRNK